MEKENTHPKVCIFNPGDENCPLCYRLNRVYINDLFEAEVEIPAMVGQGYYRKIVLNSSMKVLIGDMTFHQRLTMSGKHDSSLYNFAFCLGDGFQWSVEGDNQEYEINCGQSYVFDRNHGASILSTYFPGQRILGINIELGSETVMSLMQQQGIKKGKRFSYSSSVICSGEFSPGIRLILSELMNCPYRNQLKKMYLEGKILELVAVYLNEVAFERREGCSSARLYSCDVEALRQAKEILDKNITCPPTIGKLAKSVCLNEYKLKTGFKELFGMPVHAYIINKRMEMARFFIEEKKLRVTEAALLVGYNDLSFFAEKFRKKYGIKPSEFSKSLS